MIALEIARPRRREFHFQIRRWLNHFGLTLIGNLIIRLTLPITAVSAGLYTQQHQLGLLNLIDLPAGLVIVLAIILLDLAVYLQHRLFHAVPLLWRLHRVHHSDTEFDSSTALRFHPLELLLSMAIKSAIVVALGAPVFAIIIFEVILSSAALFNHGNFKLPLRFDRYLRWCIVTPDMHRIHHSTYPMETDSNFGFFLSIWDRCFKTYTKAPRQAQDQFDIGLKEFRKDDQQTLTKLLVQPIK